ncbi:ABC transporter permease [Actinomadura sp. SCN-SB]|uniref:ABC transporter permease n=1 Tax=Actinomadura sp. SCN-SB TaxID=3373092 RepID=UPI00375232FC
MSAPAAPVIKGKDTPDAATALPAVPKVRRRRSPLLWLSVSWLALVVLLAAFSALLPLAGYGVPAGFPRSGPTLSLDGLLGFDHLGRSVLSRAVYGSRASLIVGAVSSVTAMVVGTLFGLIAGYFRGWVDAVVMYLTDALLAFPPLVLLLALASVLRPSYTTLLVGLTLVVIPPFARLARANTLAWSNREFVLAATNMGAGRLRIAVREVLPNILPPVVAYLPTVLAALIVAEGSLSFLGMGIPSPTPSWGGMIADGRTQLYEAPQLVLLPALIIFLTVFALNQCGDHFRERVDRAVHD